MNPASIKYLLDQAELLHQQDPPNTGSIYTAFTTSWIAWEALRTRFIRVVIHQKGWLLKDADKVLAKCHISSTKKAKDVLVRLDVKDPYQWSGQSGKVWRALSEIEPLRHRLIHGFKSVEPARIQAATEIVIYAVKNHDWLSNVPLVEAPRKQDVVGSILTPRRSSKKTHDRTLDELAQIMDVSLAGGTSSIPSMERLESLTQKICIDK